MQLLLKTSFSTFFFPIEYVQVRTEIEPSANLAFYGTIASHKKESSEISSVREETHEMNSYYCTL